MIASESLLSVQMTAQDDILCQIRSCNSAFNHRGTLFRGMYYARAKSHRSSVEGRNMFSCAGLSTSLYYYVSTLRSTAQTTTCVIYLGVSLDI